MRRIKDVFDVLLKRTRLWGKLVQVPREHKESGRPRRTARNVVISKDPSPWSPRRRMHDPVRRGNAGASLIGPEPESAWAQPEEPEAWSCRLEASCHRPEEPGASCRRPEVSCHQPEELEASWCRPEASWCRPEEVSSRQPEAWSYPPEVSLLRPGRAFRRLRASCPGPCRSTNQRPPG